MKKMFLKTLLVLMIVFAPLLWTARADVQLRVNIPLPPPIIFPVPPHVVVIPETDVYVVPDVRDDIFFYGGWWWRPWSGRWYRSRHHDRGWVYYNRVPHFYRRVALGWRGYYHDRRWRGHEWHYHPIPHHEMERNWRGWKKDRYWEKSNNWGVRGMRYHPPGKPPRYNKPDTKRPKSAPPGPRDKR